MSYSEDSAPLMKHEAESRCSEDDGSQDTLNPLFRYRNTKLQQRRGSVLAVTFLTAAAFTLVTSFLVFLAVKAQSIDDSLKMATAPMTITTGSHEKATTGITDCGSTPDEARAAGCRFDMMNFGWFPPQCWDGELYDEVVNSRNWTWTTKHGAHPVSSEEAQSGNHQELLTTWDFHLVHCVYAWQKFTRAVLRGRPLDEWSARYMHAKHCGHELLNSERFPADAMVTLTVRWYPKCGLDEKDMLEMLTKYRDGDDEGGHKEVEGHAHEHQHEHNAGGM